MMELSEHVSIWYETHIQNNTIYFGFNMNKIQIFLLNYNIAFIHLKTNDI